MMMLCSVMPYPNPPGPGGEGRGQVQHGNNQGDTIRMQLLPEEVLERDDKDNAVEYSEVDEVEMLITRVC